MTRIAPAAILAAALALSACAGDPNDPTASFGGRQLFSTGLGAGAGGLIGSRFGRGSGKLAMTGLGTLVGGAAGLWLSQPQQPAYAVRPMQPAYGYPSPSAYGMQPGYGYQQQQPMCREAAMPGLINGRAEQINAIVCLGPDGVWRRVQ